jgi:hypothetical protein
MYVLLFVDNTNQPRYIQGTLRDINRELRKCWEGNEIDHDYWEYHQSWTLLGVEDGRLTPVEQSVMNMVPQVEVF